MVSQQIISVVVFETLSSVFVQQIEDYSFPEVENEHTRVLSIEHKRNANEEDDHYHNDSEVITHLLNNSQIRTSFLVLMKHYEGVACNIELAVEIDEAEEVDEGS